MAEKKMKNLEDLLEHSLQDIYDAEKQIIKALPKMIEKASSNELKKGFKEHLDMTNRQVERLETIFKDLDKPVKGKHCKGMEGLIKEGEEMMSEPMDAEVLDAALIASAQKIEHYEISSYGTARTFAKSLGHNEAARMLDQIADEEGQTDKKLTMLAESHINRKAK